MDEIILIKYIKVTHSPITMRTCTQKGSGWVYQSYAKPIGISKNYINKMSNVT